MHKYIHDFIDEQVLPTEYLSIIKQHWLPLASEVAKDQRRPLIVGINGAQGSGKTTMASCLRLLLQNQHNLKTLVLSLDDLYLPKSERESLAKHVHPLLAVRGVPGTHDVSWGRRIFDAIKQNKSGEILLPRFDKVCDDRVKELVSAQLPLDVVIFEGWCVGATSQSERQLENPINTLEMQEDKDGRWRQYVNQQLNKDYQGLFSAIDILCHLKMSDWCSIIKRRKLQEHKLISTKGRGMNDADIEAFMLHFQRLTVHQMDTMPNLADRVYRL